MDVAPGIGSGYDHPCPISRSTGCIGSLVRGEERTFCSPRCSCRVEGRTLTAILAASSDHDQYGEPRSVRRAGRGSSTRPPPSGSADRAGSAYLTTVLAVEDRRESGVDRTSAFGTGWPNASLHGARVSGGRRGRDSRIEALRCERRVPRRDGGNASGRDPGIGSRSPKGLPPNSPPPKTCWTFPPWTPTSGQQRP